MEKIRQYFPKKCIDCKKVIKLPTTGYQKRCPECRKINRKKQTQKYHKEHYETILERAKRWNREHRELCMQRSKDYYYSHKNATNTTKT